MKILVTGGAGYVGSVLVLQLLEAGHTVRVLDRLVHGGESLMGAFSNECFQLFGADIRDEEAVRAALDGVEAVVHLAAIVGDPACGREPELAREVNLGASLQLLALCRELGVDRFVFASTCSNYGRMLDRNGYVDESTPLHPVSLYAETKVEVERAVLDLPGRGMVGTALRFATVYGISPRMRFDLTVNEFTRDLILQGRLQVYGEQFWRPYVHVTDVAQAVRRVLAASPERVRGEVFNVGDTRENYTKRQLVEQIKHFAPNCEIEYVRREEDPRDYRVRFEKIAHSLAFEINRRVPDGIAEIARLVDSQALMDPSDPRYRN